MNQLTASYREVTGYSVKGTAILAVLGFGLVLFTFPNLFYRLSEDGLPIGMAPIVEAARGIAGEVIDAQRDRFLHSLRLPLAVALPLMVWLLVGATGVRAIRATSWRPIMTMVVNGGLGLLAFPVFAWTVQLVVWVVGLGARVQAWIVALQASELANMVRTVGLVVIAIAAGVGLIWLLAKSPTARWVVGGVVLAGGLLYLLRDWLASIIGPPWATIASGASAVGGAVAYGFGFVWLAVWAVAAWLLALLVLAYMGSTMLTPLRDAARSGREVDRFADVAAGVGVAASTLITAAVYNAQFGIFLQASAETRREIPGLGALPSVLDLSFARVMPEGFHDFFVMLFKGFNGAPDLLLIALACAIGIMSLAFTPGAFAPATSKPTIVTLGFLRVILAMVAVLVVLLFTSFDSG